MFNAFANIFRIPDLRNRVLFTLGVLAVYRMGMIIISPTATQKYSPEERRAGKPEALVGCGPFKLVEWVKGTHLVMDRFDKYFEPGLPYLDRVIIRVIKDPVTQMAAFKAGKKEILIATDVAARGIDVDDVTHVINHTIPDEDQTYLHRAGRTGRAGKTGICVTFVDWEDLHKWALINRALAGLAFQQLLGLLRLNGDNRAPPLGAHRHAENSLGAHQASGSSRDRKATIVST